jgi:hypothetical protein
MAVVMANWDANDKLKLTISPRQKTQHREQRLVDLSNGAVVTPALETEMMLWLRCYAPFASLSKASQLLGNDAAVALHLGRRW